MKKLSPFSLPLLNCSTCSVLPIKIAACSLYAFSCIIFTESGPRIYVYAMFAPTPAEAFITINEHLLSLCGPSSYFIDNILLVDKNATVIVGVLSYDENQYYCQIYGLNGAKPEVLREKAINAFKEEYPLLTATQSSLLVVPFNPNPTIVL